MCNSINSNVIHRDSSGRLRKSKFLSYLVCGDLERLNIKINFHRTETIIKRPFLIITNALLDPWNVMAEHIGGFEVIVDLVTSSFPYPPNILC